ncbi:MAG: aminotransferase class III-fold pyridoxal phosphate-dependent enzyme, partial [bacterium]
SEIMLVFDEVQTGIGLTGEMWGHQHFGVEPDMLAFGKKTQVCGFICSKRIDEVENNVFEESTRINSTWGGNLVDMVRFRKYLEIIVTEKLIDNAKNVGEYFLNQLMKVQNEFEGFVTNVRGRGLMIAFDLPTGDLRSQYLTTLFNNGLIALGCGTRSVRFRPSLNLTKDVVDESMEIIQKSLKEVFEKSGEKVTVVEDEAPFER